MEQLINPAGATKQFPATKRKGCEKDKGSKDTAWNPKRFVCHPNSSSPSFFFVCSRIHAKRRVPSCNLVASSFYFYSWNPFSPFGYPPKLQKARWFRSSWNGLPNLLWNLLSGHNRFSLLPSSSNTANSENASTFETSPLESPFALRFPNIRRSFERPFQILLPSNFSESFHDYIDRFEREQQIPGREE